jgi:hypothetical protein
MGNVMSNGAGVADLDGRTGTSGKTVAALA